MQVETVKYLLMVCAMSRAVRFYTEVFGFNPTTVSEHWSELAFGNAIVALHGGGDGTVNRTGLSIQVSDARSAGDKIAQAGGAMAELPSQREGEPILPGAFHDPEGNALMLTQYVG